MTSTKHLYTFFRTIINSLESTKIFNKIAYVLLLGVLIVTSVTIVSADTTHCVYINQDDEQACLINTGGFDTNDFIQECEDSNLGDFDVHLINVDEGVDSSDPAWSNYDFETAMTQCSIALGCSCDEDAPSGFVTQDEDWNDFTPISQIQGDTCSQHCSSDFELATLSGNVTFESSGDIVPQTSIQAVPNFDGNERQALTNSIGNYNIEEMTPGEYTVTATRGANCNDERTLNIDGAVRLNFQFEDDCLDSGDDVIDDPEDIPQLPGPNEDWCNPEENPNFVPENKHVCNPFGDEVQYFEIDGEQITCLDFDGAIGGELECNPNTCLVNPNVCDFSEDEESECLIENPAQDLDYTFTRTLLSAENSHNVELRVELNELACEDLGVSYELTSCEPILDENGDSTCSQENTLNSGPLENVVIYTHENPFGDGNIPTMCYTLYLEGEEVEQLCINKPEPFCQDKPPGDYCDGNEIVSCDENGLETGRSGCSDGSCAAFISEDQPIAYCQSEDDLGICDACNGLFGLHPENPGNIGSQVTVQIGDDERVISQCNPEYTGSANEMYGICYADSYSSAWTSVGQFDSCANVNSCYDYGSENSCQQNPCGNSQANDCGWNTLSATLGTGVCAPEDDDLLECELCGEDGRNCTDDLCSAHGNECFYRGPSTPDDALPACISPDNHVCEMYTTEQECVGDSVYEANIGYVDGDIQRRQGNHERTSLSGDAKGVGICTWNQNQNTCNRDADLALRLTETPQSAADCSPLQDDYLECLSDTVPPRTTIDIDDGDVFSATQLTSFNYQASDNYYAQSDLKTFFTLERTIDCERTFSHDGTQYCYPTQEKQDIVDNINFESPGRTSIFYFSKDGSKNLERIKETRFRIIAGIEEAIQWGTEVEYEEIPNSGIFRADLHVRIQNTNPESYPNEPFECLTDVKRLDGNNNAQSVGNPRTSNSLSVKHTFMNLESGSYEVTIRCEDDYDQIFTDSETVNIDSDNVMREMQPQGLIVRQGDLVDINFSTVQPAVCEYTLDQSFGEEMPISPPTNHQAAYNNYNWQSFETENNQHSAQIQASQNEGFNRIYPRCIFELGDGTEYFYYGGPQHIGFYVIDETGPAIDILRGGAPYDPSVPSEGMTLEISLTDRPIIMRNGGEEVFNFGANLEDVTYCISETSCTPNQQYNPSEGISIEKPTQPTDISLTVRAVDNGGNSNTRTVNLNLINLDFQEPTVLICDQEGDVCL